ncbi:hypothetical protein EON63_20910 [archaeon]|nr:MAG: hypothetical protein EON63_20910 [archaeon]
MVRATHGVHEGSYYWEAEVLPSLGDDAHVRIGWSTREGELQAPVGYDQHSYAYRDIAGSMVHKSTRIDEYGEAYGVGDVIGCHLIISSDLAQNKMSFFKNGRDQGMAYSADDIPFGVYFPALSLYKQAVVRVNFGPSFIIKPDIMMPFLPVSELQPLNPQDRKV